MLFQLNEVELWIQLVRFRSWVWVAAHFPHHLFWEKGVYAWFSKSLCHTSTVFLTPCTPFTDSIQWSIFFLFSPVSDPATFFVSESHPSLTLATGWQCTGPSLSILYPPEKTHLGALVLAIDRNAELFQYHAMPTWISTYTQATPSGSPVSKSHDKP